MNEYNCKMSINNIPKNTLQELFEPMVNMNISKEAVIDQIKSNAVSYSKVNLILEQINFLKLQLNQTINDSILDINLHNVDCKFVKISGNVYHLYKDNNNNYYFSMLSKSNWNDKPPHIFIASYLYDYDKCFKLIKN